MNAPTYERHMNGSSHEVLEARLGMRVCATLNEDPRALPASVQERLRFAREEACRLAPRHLPQVERRPAWQQWLAPSNWISGLRSEGSLGWKLVGLVPAALLVLGFVGIHSLDQEEQTQAAAEVDVALLSDDLPPSAYSDPGFAEYLKASGQLSSSAQP